MDIFYAVTTISLGNGRKTPYWDASRLEGKSPKDVAPRIFELCKRKKWTVAQVLQDNEWITKLSTEATISIEHLIQFLQFWALIRNVQLNDELEDDISWKLTSNGEYSTASAYNCNSLALLSQVSTRSFGRLGRRQKRRTILASFAK
jgi:hypothetical protein